MPYQPIDVELMRSKLMTVDAVKERLDPTEGLREIEFDTKGRENAVSFDFPDDWNVGLSDKRVDGFTPTTANVTIDGETFQLTKDAAAEAGSKVGLQKSYMLTTPGNLTTPHLNHWYRNGARGQDTMKLLAGRNGVAFTRGTITPFSNHALLDAALQGIQDKYGTDDVLVDYKFHHDLNKTKLRLIVPHRTHNVGSARAASGNDPWSVGLELSNSVIGASSLELSGYLFAWWCTNGSTFTQVSSGKYRRKPSLSPNDAYEWARQVVDEVLGDLEHEFESIDALTRINLDGELNQVTGPLFERFKVPVGAREQILLNFAESDDLTAYGLMNAITAAANDGEMSEGDVNNLLSAGGRLAHIMASRCDSCGNFADL